jgi:hypothetical protein
LIIEENRTLVCQSVEWLKVIIVFPLFLSRLFCSRHAGFQSTFVNVLTPISGKQKAKLLLSYHGILPAYHEERFASGLSLSLFRVGAATHRKEKPGLRSSLGIQKNV